VDDVVLIDRNPRTTTGAVVDDLLSAARKIEIPAVRLFIPLLTVIEKRSEAKRSEIRNKRKRD